jgi:hypothetical protein
MGSLIPRGLDEGTYWFTVVLFPVAAGSLAVVAGALLLLREPLGVYLSLLVQASQIAAFSGTWRFVFRTGIWVTWLINSSGSGILPGVGGQGAASTEPPDGTLSALGTFIQFKFGFFASGRATPEWSVGINLVALYLTWLLLRLIHQRASQSTRGPTTAAA